MSAASKAIRVNPEIDVAVYEKSGNISYGSCGLPYFAGDVIKTPEELISLNPADAKKRGIAAYIRHEVTNIDRTGKKISVINLDTGENFERAYDSLVIATGAKPLVPNIAGISGGVHYLRTVEDGVSFKKAALSSRSGIIVGGGGIGLETAEALAHAGVRVTVVDSATRLLPFLNEKYSEAVLQCLIKNGVQVELGNNVQEIISRGGKICGVVTEAEIPGEFVLISAGTVPNTSLAEKCGLKLGVKNTIRVDTHMRTSDQSIWACGDCAQTFHIITGEPVYFPLGTTANKQGRIAGGNIAGENVEFKGVLCSQVTKVFDLYIASTGLTHEQALNAGFRAQSESIMKSDRASYYPGGSDNMITLTFDGETGRVLGAQGIGGISIAGRINVLVTAISSGGTIDDLNSLDLVYSPSVAPVYDPILIAAAQALKKVKRKI